MSLIHVMPLSVLSKLPQGCAKPVAGVWSTTLSTGLNQLAAYVIVYTTTEYHRCTVVSIVQSTEVL